VKIYIIVGLIFSSLNVYSDEAFLSNVLKEIKASSEYKSLYSACPDKIFNGPEIKFQHHVAYCTKNELKCFSLCNRGSGNHCFGLAYSYMDKKVSTKYSEALLAKSCALGLVSGCTNRSAFIKSNEEKTRAKCAFNTFKLTCSKKDAWGCAMYGLVLSEGSGGQKNIDLALQKLKIACIKDKKDPACEYAKSLGNKIRKESANK